MLFNRLLTNELDLGLRYELWPALEESSKKLMVVMHGRGDTMEGFHWFPEALGLDSFNYLFLNAPDPYASGYSWYDLPPNQGPGVVRSRKILMSALDLLQQQCGLKSTDIFLFGFSQGCLMALDLGLRYPSLLGGIIGASGYVFFMDEYPQSFSKCAKNQRFLVTHGTEDDVLPLETTRDSVDRLRALGICIDWREYEITHTVDPQREMDDFRERLLFWLEAS